MILKYNKDLVIKNRTWEDEQADAYTFKIIWTLSDDIYWEVFWDTALFTSDNPTVLLVQEIPRQMNAQISTKLKNVNSYKDLLKAKTRNRIDTEVWDVYDLIADLSKRQTMGERLLMRVMLPFLKWEAISQELKDIYVPMMEQYLGWIDAWLIRDRTDLEDAITIFSEWAAKMTKIADIVKDEYINKM